MNEKNLQIMGLEINTNPTAGGVLPSSTSRGSSHWSHKGFHAADEHGKPS